MRKMSMSVREEAGGALTTFLLIVVFIAAAIMGMKVFPAYLEYFAVQRTLKAMAAAGETNAPIRDIKAAFGRRATINDVKSVGADQLEVVKEGGTSVVSISYPVSVPLFANVKLVIDFSASSAQ
jgi:hypothetical protein